MDWVVAQPRTRSTPVPNMNMSGTLGKIDFTVLDCTTVVTKYDCYQMINAHR